VYDLHGNTALKLLRSPLDPNSFLLQLSLGLVQRPLLILVDKNPCSTLERGSFFHAIPDTLVIGDDAGIPEKIYFTVWPGNRVFAVKRTHARSTSVRTRTTHAHASGSRGRRGILGVTYTGRTQPVTIGTEVPPRKKSGTGDHQKCFVAHLKTSFRWLRRKRTVN
jgi:hypothetical protein